MPTVYGTNTKGLGYLLAQCKQQPLTERERLAEEWYTCDKCGEYHQREFSLLCEDCELEAEEIAEEEEES